MVAFVNGSSERRPIAGIRFEDADCYWVVWKDVEEGMPEGEWIDKDDVCVDAIRRWNKMQEQ